MKLLSLWVKKYMAQFLSATVVSRDHHERPALCFSSKTQRRPFVLRLCETTRSHVRKVLGQPELPMLLINENSDPDDVAAGGQDILAMTIIGRLFAHHGLMQAQRSIDGLIAGFSNILCCP